MWKLWTPWSNAVEQSQRLSEPQAVCCLQTVFRQIARWSLPPPPSGFWILSKHLQLLLLVSVQYKVFQYLQTYKYHVIRSFSLWQTVHFLFLSTFIPLKLCLTPCFLQPSLLHLLQIVWRCLKQVRSHVVYVVITAVLKCWLETLKMMSAWDYIIFGSFSRTVWV